MAPMEIIDLRRGKKDGFKALDWLRVELFLEIKMD